LGKKESLPQKCPKRWDRGTAMWDSFNDLQGAGSRLRAYGQIDEVD